LGRARELCSVVDARTMKMDDRGLDIGAYMNAANELTEDQVCFLDTHSELLAPAWLKKIALHLDRPEVGMVGATGSFESLSPPSSQFPSFPNVHLRLNGFMIERELFSAMLAGTAIRDKSDADLIESGSVSLTRRVFAQGLGVQIVGRNGRGYPPPWWPSSDTFHQGCQSNLLIGDNQTRAYIAATWNEKRTLVENTWGWCLDPRNTFNLLLTNQSLRAGQKLSSPSGRFTLYMQADGNLVLYDEDPSPATAYWYTGTNSLPSDRSPTHALMQTDGQLVLYDDAMRATWGSGVCGPNYTNPYLDIQDDGNLVIYHFGRQPIWSSNTVRR
jgi:hypothetical protein